MTNDLNRTAERLLSASRRQAVAMEDFNLALLQAARRIYLDAGAPFGMTVAGLIAWFRDQDREMFPGVDAAPVFQCRFYAAGLSDERGMLLE